MSLKNNKTLTLIFISNISILAIALLFAGWNMYQTKHDAYLRGDNIVYPKSEVLGIATNSKDIFIDYNKQTGIASPYIYGGSNPRIKTPDVWNQFTDVGMKTVRVPLFVEYAVPKSTIDDYQKNVNNVQDISTWNTIIMDQQTNILKEAKRRGMKTMAVMEFSPAWLNTTPTEFSMPKDMTIYRDIVKKMYARNRDYIDYVEIWNEPNWGHFLYLSGVSLSREEAYKSIYLNAAQAIREYDVEKNDGKKAKIGGPVLSKVKENSIVKTMLSSPEVRPYLDFISVHNYDLHSVLDITPIKDLETQYNATAIPIFLTEWNYTPNETLPDPYLISEKSIGYTAIQFIKMINQGVKAGFFFALQPIDIKNIGNGQGYLAFYKMNGTQSELLPMSKSWRLFSKTLRLGVANSKNYYMTTNNNDRFIALKNPSNDKVLVAVNDSDDIIEYNVNITLEDENKKYIIDSYLTNAQDDSKPVTSISLRSINNALQFKVLIPANTTGGFIIKEDKTTIF